MLFVDKPQKRFYRLRSYLRSPVGLFVWMHFFDSTSKKKQKNADQQSRYFTFLSAFYRLAICLRAPVFVRMHFFGFTLKKKKKKTERKDCR